MSIIASYRGKIYKLRISNVSRRKNPSITLFYINLFFISMMRSKKVHKIQNDVWIDIQPSLTNFNILPFFLFKKIKSSKSVFNMWYVKKTQHKNYSHLEKNSINWMFFWQFTLIWHKHSLIRKIYKLTITWSLINLNLVPSTLIDINWFFWT